MTTSAKIKNRAIDEILSIVKTIPHVKVHEALSNEEEIKLIQESNSFDPYIVLTFSGTSQVPRRYKAMTGSRHSGGRISIVARVVAHTPSIGRAVMSEVDDRLNGHKPVGCGEIQPELYFATGQNDTKGSPARFSEIQSYSLVVS